MVEILGIIKSNFIQVIIFRSFTHLRHILNPVRIYPGTEQSASYQECLYNIVVSGGVKSCMCVPVRALVHCGDNVNTIGSEERSKSKCDSEAQWS